MDIHRTKKTGPALEDEAYKIGGDSSTEDTGIVKSTTSGEVFAYRGEFDRYEGEYAADVEHVDLNPIAAAQLLFSRVDFGPLWGADRKVLVGQPYDVNAANLIDEHTGDDWEITSGDANYRYIDDMSRRGGMMYAEDDYHMVDHTEFTRPAVEDDPDPYIEALIRAHETTHAFLLEDTTPLEERGFELEGEYRESMHSTETSTNPEAKREELSEEDMQVVIFSTGGKGNPFRTEFQVWVRPLHASVR